MILYLHGFRSSPRSFKVGLFASRMAALGRADAFACPQLSGRPAEAIEQARALIKGIGPDSLTLVGSSLGGCYATFLAEQTGCRAVLLNPALRAFEKLASQVGHHTAYHGGGPDFEFRRSYLEELRVLDVPTITRPERYFLVAATGDEVLDWREMVAGFPGARHKVIQGSDHGLADFADSIDEVLAFAGIVAADLA